MFTSRPLGNLLLHHPSSRSPATTLPRPGTVPSPQRYVYRAKIVIPLLEGGLLYDGVFATSDEDSMALSIRATRELLTAASVYEVDPGEYEVTLEEGRRPTPDAVGEASQFHLSVTEDPANPQVLHGIVTSGTTLTTFMYEDLQEPITLGAIAIVVIAVGGVSCITNQVLGYLGNRNCKKLEARYGFSFNFRGDFNSNIVCAVKCLDK